MGDSAYATKESAVRAKDVAGDPVRNGVPGRASDAAVITKAHRDAEHTKDRDGEHELDRRFEVVRAAYVSLFQKRREGIAHALERSKGYVRPPVNNHELALKLALLGINAATILISGGLAKAAELALGEVIGESGLRKVLESAVSSGVKEGVKALGGVAKNGLADKPGVSNDATVTAFFDSETDSIDDSTLAAARATVDINTLLAQLLGTPQHERAFDAVRALETAITSQLDAAKDMQMNQSVQHWVRYVANTSLGSQSGQDALTNMTAANQAPTDHAPLKQFDGLLDLQFTCSIPHPEQPPRLVSAQIRGVKREAVELLSKYSLVDLPIPIRASGAPDNNNAVLPIVVVRDESGKVSFQEDPLEPVAPSRWLARHGQGDPGLGANRLLRELLQEPLGSLLRSDDASKPKES